jgi:hypothetical protein
MSPPSTDMPGTEHSDTSDRAFLEHLRAECETCFGEPPDIDDVRRAYSKLVERYAAGTDRVTKADLYALDRLALSMASPAELWAEAPALYRRYCEERGEPVDPNDPTMAAADAAKVGALRARLLHILRGLHWSYTFGPIRETLRVRLIEKAMLAMAIATVSMAVFAAILYLWQKPFFAVLAGVVYAGVMGGLASCTLRLTEVPATADALGSIHTLKNSRYVLFFSPLTGAVFAVVAMGLMIGGVLAGSLFPAFADLRTTDAAGNWRFTQLLLPITSKDFALLFVWCFIAGFAERFVPDTLSELIQRGKAHDRPAVPVVVHTQTASRDLGGSSQMAGSGQQDGSDNVH